MLEDLADFGVVVLCSTGQIQHLCHGKACGDISRVLFKEAFFIVMNESRVLKKGRQISTFRPYDRISFAFHLEHSCHSMYLTLHKYLMCPSVKVEWHEKAR